MRPLGAILAADIISTAGSEMTAVALPWLTRHYSSILGGVGLDAEYVAGKVAG